MLDNFIFMASEVKTTFVRPTNRMPLQCVGSGSCDH